MTAATLADLARAQLAAAHAQQVLDDAARDSNASEVLAARERLVAAAHALARLRQEATP